MHPELVQIAKTAALDREIATLDAQVARHERALRVAQEAVEAVQHAIGDVDHELSLNKHQEGQINKDIEKLQRRRASATRVLDGTVTAGDPAAAQRQLEQCNDLLDDRETEVLEVLEQRDEILARRQSLHESLAEKKEVLLAAQSSTPEAVSRLKETRLTLASSRQEAFSVLPQEVQRRYNDMTRRRGTPIATIIKQACSACHFTVAAQHRSDLARGLIVPCKSCGRWLILDE